jgi:CDP-glucose 4,6-dehydratase
VLEPLYGCLGLAEAAMTGAAPANADRSFGPGPQGAQSDEALVARFIADYRADAPCASSAGLHPQDAVPPLDAARAREILRGPPALDFAETATWTAKWYRALAEGEDAGRITIAQIEAYLGSRVRLVSPFVSQCSEEARHEQSRIHG